MFFLKNKSVGIDISDYSVEAVELKRDGSAISVSGFGRVNLPMGVVERGRIKDGKKLKMAVKEAMERAEPSRIDTKDIYFGLSETRLYSHVLEIPEKKRGRIESIAREEAVKNIPIKQSDLLYAYKAIDTPEGNIKITIIGASKKLVTDWYKFFDNMGLEADFDIESFALVRGLKKQIGGGASLMIDMGAETSNFLIFSDIGLACSHTFFSGGDEITKKISETKKSADGKAIDFNEAEKIKITHGLAPDDANKDIVMPIKTSLTPLVDDIKETIRFYTERMKKPLSEIILVGGTANLKGIKEHLTSALTSFNSSLKKDFPDLYKENIMVNIGEPALKVRGDSLLFIEAIGLAMKGVDKNWEKTEPEFNLKEIKKFAKVKKLTPISTPVEEFEAAEKEEEFPEEKNWAKTHPKEVQLLVILMIGLVLIGGAFWYRGFSAKKAKSKMATNSNLFAYTQTFYASTTISTDAKFKPDEIPGRVIVKSIEKPDALDKAREKSFEEAKKEVKSDETVWKDPFIEIKDRNHIIFPLSFEWLVYSEGKINEFLMGEAKRNLRPGEKFLFKSVEINKIEKIVNKENASSSRFMLHASITVDTNSPGKLGGNISLPQDQDIKEAAATTTQTSASSSSTSSVLTIEELMKMLSNVKNQTGENIIVSSDSFSAIIKQTPTGFLNSRSGPGKEKLLVKKLLPGEQYTILEEKSGWIKLKISEIEEGWVIKDYVEKVQN